MTKQYAEMESNKEQSRVCARLPLNLQLFAEDTGENGADTNAEGAAGDTGANSDGGSGRHRRQLRWGQHHSDF